MVSCTLLLSNVPRTVLAAEFVKFVEKFVGEGAVYACDIRTERSYWKSRGEGRIQFENAESARKFMRLSEQGALLMEDCNVHVSYSDKDMILRPNYCFSDAKLFAGSLLNPNALAVLWSADDVQVDISCMQEKIAFHVCEKDVQYKMELGFEDITGTCLCRMEGNGNYCVLIKSRCGLKIWEKWVSEDTFSAYMKKRYKFCKEETEVQWVRTTDFSQNCAIGQSALFCLEVPNFKEHCEIFEKLPFYEAVREELLIEKDVLHHPQTFLVPYIRIPEDVNLPYDTAFQLNSLVHNNILSAPTITHELLRMLGNNQIPSLHIELAFAELRKLKTICFEPENWFRNKLRVLRSMDQKKLKSTTVASGKELMKFYRVLVTPSKVYFLGPELNLSNRVTREFSKYIDDFLRVSFVDDDFGKLHSTALSVRSKDALSGSSKKTKLHQRILSVLRDGIVINNKKFLFLAFSASQLRENSLWMFSSNDEVSVEYIRQWMGNFEDIRNVAKYAARMGQSFSSSWAAATVPESRQIENIEDIEVTTNGVKYCFSDGIGKISSSFAKQIATKCDIPMSNCVPSAFQIRYAGYKGVVAIDPRSYKKMSLRPSMRKFDSTHSTVDVLNWSRSLPCYLNREIVTLLSTLEVPDKNFEILQNKSLSYLHKLLTDTESAMDALQLMSSGDENKIMMEMLSNGYSPDSEPFLSMMLLAFRNSHLLEHRIKCRIFIPKGRVLMGCLDETAKLNYGQVFIQVSKMKTGGNDDGLGWLIDSSKTCILQGKVIVAKNPCLHPGDIRVLEAVNIPELKHMIDCIVFPQKGKRPHPNECSGSDLDGDLYFVSWEQLLIPPKQVMPADYPNRPRVLLDHKVTSEEIQEYFLNFMLNDSLGLIATAHVIHADMHEKKALSNECIELARLQSKAVDFAKTGVPAEMPLYLFPKKYPDFMEREGESYMSPGILGKLYRAVKNEMDENSLYIEEASQEFYDEDMEIDGFQDLLDEASMHKNWYDAKLVELMRYYGVENEAEIISGNISHSSKAFSRERKKTSEIKDKIVMAVKTLRSEAVHWFKDSCAVHRQESALASAWYYVTYHPRYRSENHLISFPWVQYERLFRIKLFNLSKRTIQAK